MKRIFQALAALLVGVTTTTSAAAQVPPHAPGTICFVPGGWCWAEPPGPPGGFCECWDGLEWIPGTLG